VDRRYDDWPLDFAKRGGIRPDYKPTSRTIFIQKGSKFYFLIFAEYYILCGTRCASIKNGLCGTWSNGEWRNKERPRLSYGLVEVPITARREPALIRAKGTLS
jgi:hypothetical protein